MTDAEVRAIAAAISTGIASDMRVQMLRDKLALEFGARQGWTLRRNWSQKMCSERPPCIDHSDFYQTGRRIAALVIQPYNCTDLDKSLMKRWAIDRKRAVHFPAYPSWHYPRWTTLCVFTWAGIEFLESGDILE